jgi:hypothetical protein
LLARIAIVKPLAKLNVQADEDALQQIVQDTHGYPYFIQEWGKHSWDVADDSPITLDDVKQGSSEAIAESFFRVRFDRLTPVEKR